MILTEPQGVASIAAVNGDAEVVVVDSWSDFEEAWQTVLDAKPIKIGGQHGAEVSWSDGSKSQFQTLVIDSLTDLQQLMIDHMKGGGGGLEDRPMTQQQWGRLLNTMSTIMRDQRSLPVSVVMTALAQERYEKIGDSDVRRVIPMLMGQMAHKLGQFCNAVAYATQDKGGVPTLVWKQDSRFHSKPAPGFPALTRHTLEPGTGSLGSLLLMLWNEKTTPHAKGDSAEKSNGAMSESESEKQQKGDAKNG